PLPFAEGESAVAMRCGGVDGVLRPCARLGARDARSVTSDADEHPGAPTHRPHPVLVEVIGRRVVPPDAIGRRHHTPTGGNEKPVAPADGAEPLEVIAAVFDDRNVVGPGHAVVGRADPAPSIADRDERTDRVGRGATGTRAPAAGRASPNVTAGVAG